jgi:pilus assembly protein CpaB
MNVRRLFVACLLALGAISAWARRSRPVRRAAVPNVVLATRDIRRGALIEPSWIAGARWPADSVPADAFSHVDNVVGRVATVDVTAGEPITNGRLAGPVIPTAVDPYRATRSIALRVQNAAELGVDLRPDSRVDVYVSDDRRGSMARLALENVPVTRVEAVATAMPGDSGWTTVATLAITGEQVERLAAAAHGTSARFLLRRHDPARGGAR